MTQLDDDLTRLVREDPLPASTPDTAGVIRAGSRLRRRRRLAVTAGAGLAAAAVIAPFALLTGGSDTVGMSPADAPVGSSADARGVPSATPRDDTTEKLVTLEELRQREQLPSSCGVMACAFVKGDASSPETGEIIGEVVEMGTFEGHTEVLYAARVRGVDLRTSTKADVDVLMAGIRDADGTIRRTVWALQPGTEPGEPVLRAYGGEQHADETGDGTHYGVIGFVAGVHDRVTVTQPDGTTRDVLGVSHDVLPGWTVFHDGGPWQAAWDGGDPARAPLTYGVPGGASCALTECGTMG